MSNKPTRSSFVKTIKGSLFDCLYPLGRILLLNKFPPILAYHSIDESDSEISVAPSEFRRQMIFLKNEGYNTIALDDYVAIIKENKEVPQKSFVMTFDDGYHNNYSFAYPLLKELDFSATIYLSTGYIGGYCDWIKDSSIPRLKMLEWPSILEMAAGGITFGAHTTSHPQLTKLKGHEIEKELLESRALIEGKLATKVTSCCYPYGYFDDRVVQIVKNCGFDSACSQIYGVKNDIKSIFALKRLSIGPGTTLQYLRFIFSGFYDLNMARKRVAGKQ